MTAGKMSAFAGYLRYFNLSDNLVKQQEELCTINLDFILYFRTFFHKIDVNSKVFTTFHSI